MTVCLNYDFLKDEWVRRDECKEFLDFTLDMANKYLIAW